MADPIYSTMPYQIPAGVNPMQYILGGYGPNTGAVNQGGYSLMPTDPTTQLLQSLAPILTGAYDLGTAGLNMNTARQAAGMADPFSGERGLYQPGLRQYMGANPVNPALVTSGTNTALGMLSRLLEQPQMLTSMPGYQFGLGQALEAVNRGAGASGLLNSGNRLAALQDRGQGYAHQWFQDLFGDLLGNVGANINAANLGLAAQGQGYQELANLSGVNAGNPGLAGQLLNQGRQQQANTVGAGIGGIAAGAGNAISAFQRLLGSSGPLGGLNPGIFNSAGQLPDITSQLPSELGGFDQVTNGLDLSSLFGLDSTSSLGTSGDIFSGLMDAFG